jgi:hypothetical protein
MSSRLLLHDPQPQIGQLVGLAEGDSLQIDPPVALAAEEPDTVAEEHRSRGPLPNRAPKHCRSAPSQIPEQGSAPPTDAVSCPHSAPK